MTTLCNKLENYFVSTKSSYLGGDTPSASDVCVAIWMHHNNNNNAVMGPATTTWTNAVCSLAVIQEFCATTEHITEQLTTLTMDDGNLILAKLKEWNIPHSVYSHPLCHSAEELVATVPIPINDSHTKNLLLKDKKHGMFLFVVATKSHIDTKSLGKLLGLEGKVNFRLADEATLDSALNVKPGCVGPLCSINNAAGDITVVMDQALMTMDQVHSHPLRNDMSVIMKPTDIHDYIVKTGHTVTMMEFAVAGNTATTITTEKPKQTPKVVVAKKVDPNKKMVKKGETLLALQWKKSENFPMWYSDVIVLSEMISYYDISGCYILRPWSYKIWELITEWFNAEVSQALMLFLMV